MFDSIVLLTDPVEQPVLASLLRIHGPHLTIVPAITSADLAALEPGLLRRARLIGFITPVIVPAHILDQLGFGAYNFHPGPPEYPGWAPAHFALYDQASSFGVTLHAMTRRVDDGPIIDSESFAIPPDIPVLDLEALAYVRLVQIFRRHSELLATQPSPLTPIARRWGAVRSTRQRYQAMCDIPLTIPKEELKRRIRVFGGNHFGIAPTIQLHGVRFQAIAPDTEPVGTNALTTQNATIAAD